MPAAQCVALHMISFCSNNLLRRLRRRTCAACLSPVFGLWRTSYIHCHSCIGLVAERLKGWTIIILKCIATYGFAFCAFTPRAT